MPLKKSGGPIVGLDIGSSFIKVCEIDCRGGRVNLRGIAVVPTPPDAVVNNEIVNPVVLGRTVRDVLRQAGIKANRVVTSVTGQSSLVVRIIEVPKMTPAELKETMKWEIERHVPFANEQVVMDYQPLVPTEEVPDGQNMEILLAVAQESLVTRHVEALQAAGLKPVAIDIEPLAYARALLDLSNGAGPTGTVAILDVGASTTDIGIYRDGRIAFTRSIQLAGNNLTKAISDVLGQPLADAERLKKEMAAIPENPSAGAAGAGITGMGGMGGGMFDPDGGFGALPTLSFGDTQAEPLSAGFLGQDPVAPGAPDPGAGTATQAEPMVDVAGGGFTPDAFAISSAPVTAPAGASPFDLSVGGDPAVPAADPTLSGPVPGANPFDPDAGAVPPPAPAPAGPVAPEASPFDASLFGPQPGANPFGLGDPVAAPAPAAPADDFGGFGGLGDPAGAFGDPVPGVGFGDPIPGVGFGASDPAMPAMSEEEYLRTQIADAVMPVLHELVTELRRSLDFYRNRANGLGAEQVIITGGTAKLRGLADFLTANLEVPVVVGNPLDYVSKGPKVDANYLADIGPVFPVSVGLAARELLVDPAPARKKR